MDKVVALADQLSLFQPRGVSGVSRHAMAAWRQPPRCGETRMLSVSISMVWNVWNMLGKYRSSEVKNAEDISYCDYLSMDWDQSAILY